MRALLALLFFSLSLSVHAAELQVAVAVTGSDIAVTVENRGTDAAAAPHLRVSVEPALQLFTRNVAGWTCTRSTGVMDCERDVLPAGAQHVLRFGLVGPGPFAPGHYTVTAEVGSARAQAQLTIGRSWVLPVDSSAGTLRAAIEEANAVCDGTLPCLITFFDHPEILPKTLFPSSPLPVITACSLTLRSMERAPPDFTWGINGSDLASGEGLVFNPRCEGTRIVIDGFYIAGFPGDGIAIIGPTRATYDFRRLGVNGRSRGIAVDAPNAELTVSHSTIGATSRSAITVWAAQRTTIANVRIGVSEHGSTLPVGASGVFVGPTGGDLTVRNSILANARDFGIALARGNATVSLEGAILTANPAGDIDWGLDGPSFDANLPVTPRVDSATYDATRNVTRIRTDAHVQVWSSTTLTRFLNAHLEQFVGLTDATGVVESAGDLRGRYVSALRVDGRRVSEVSFAVQVK